MAVLLDAVFQSGARNEKSAPVPVRLSLCLSVSLSFPLPLSLFFFSPRFLFSSSSLQNM